MATTKAKAAPAATPAKKAAAPAAAAPQGATPAAAAPAAPRYAMGPWPAKARAGNSIRAYCYQVANALHNASPNGFTLAEFASALAANAAGSDLRQPGTGWGTAAKPNGAALAHANWFAHAKQGWLTKAEA